MNRRDTALAALVAALWGFNFVVIDWGMGSVPPLLFAAIRFTVVAVPACFLVPRPPLPFRKVAAVGAFMSLGQFGFLYLSMHLGMPPGLAALVLQAQVPLTIVIAAAVLREPPSRAQVAGVALGVLGLVIVARGLGGHVTAAALALCLLAGLSWAVGNVVSRAARAPGGLALTVWSATVAPVPLLGLSLLTDGPAAVAHGLAHLGWHGVLSTVYTAGLCSLVGYAIFNRLLSRYPSGQVVPWVLLAPVVAMASAWALLGEAPGLAELAGAVLLVTGVLIAQGTLRPSRPGAARSRHRQPGRGVTPGSGGRQERGPLIPADAMDSPSASGRSPAAGLGSLARGITLDLGGAPNEAFASLRLPWASTWRPPSGFSSSARGPPTRRRPRFAAGAPSAVTGAGCAS